MSDTLVFARQWYDWIAFFLMGGALTATLAFVGGYLLTVVRPRYGPKS